MLRKLIDNFDISSLDWDLDTPNPDYGGTDIAHQNFVTTHITTPACNTWSLWVRNPTTFDFVDPTQYDFQNIESLIPLLCKMFQSKTIKDLPPTEISKFIRAYLDWCNPGHKKGSIFGRRFINDSTLYVDEVLNSITRAQHRLPTDNDHPAIRHILLPNSLINPKTIAKIPDIFQLTDATTALGLEKLETFSTILPPLGVSGCILLSSLFDKANTQNPTNQIMSSSTYRPSVAVIADITLSLWWTLQHAAVRKNILAAWPGWVELFIAEDTLLHPSFKTMSAAVLKKSPTRSALRRFCMQIAWNLNPHNTKIPYSPHLKPVLDKARQAWPGITNAPDDLGAKLQAVYDFVNSLHLNCEEEPQKRTSAKPPVNEGLLRGPRTAGDFSNNTTRARKNANLHTVTVDPTTAPSDLVTNPPPPPALILPPTNWNKPHNLDLDSGEAIKARFQEWRAEHDTARKYQQQHRQAIADQISAAAWFVPAPPPSEHNQLSGLLDEGNLLNFAAFADPKIFSASPELGYGDIVLGILIDASGSMASTPKSISENESVSCLDAAACFVGGVRDGLSRHPNVHIQAYTYNGIEPHHPDYQKMYPELKTCQLTNRSGSICVLHRLDTDDDLWHVTAEGGTPTAPALLSLHNHLELTYPNARHLILILTDGAPCGTVCHPHFSSSTSNNYYQDNEKGVHKVVTSISTPVFCVGLDVSPTVLAQQYNKDHSFVVSSPLEATSVACNLVQAIGKTLS